LELIKIPKSVCQEQNGAVLQIEFQTLTIKITTGAIAMSNIPKINLRNSLTECGQSIRKENAGKFQNYAILDCKASIAAGKIK